MNRFLWVLVVSMLAFQAVSSRGDTFLWNGTGAPGGATVNNSLLNNPSLQNTWTLNGALTSANPTISSMAVVMLASGVSLGQSGSLNIGTFNFDTGSTFGTITFSRRNTFTSFSAIGSGQIDFTGSLTRISDSATFGDGVSPFYVLLQGGSLSAPGEVTLNNATFTVRSGTLQTGGLITLVGNSRLQVYGSGNFTVPAGSVSGVQAFNSSAIDFNYNLVASKVLVSSFIKLNDNSVFSSTGTFTIAASGSVQLANSSSFQVAGGEFINLGILALKDNSYLYGSDVNMNAGSTLTMQDSSSLDVFTKFAATNSAYLRMFDASKMSIGLNSRLSGTIQMYGTSAGTLHGGTSMSAARLTLFSNSGFIVTNRLTITNASQIDLFNNSSMSLLSSFNTTLSGGTTLTLHDSARFSVVANSGGNGLIVGGSLILLDNSAMDVTTGTFKGSANIKLGSNSSVTVTNFGTFNLSGSNFSMMTNASFGVGNGGRFSITSSNVILSDNASLGLGGSTFTLPSGSNLTLSGNANFVVTGSAWTNSGFIRLQGGQLSTGNGTGLFVNKGTLSAGSVINSNVLNSSSFTILNPATITGNFTNAAAGITQLLGNVTLTIRGANPITNDGTLLVNSGTVNTLVGVNNPGFILLNGGGIIGLVTNTGQISGTGYINIFTPGGGTIQANDGTLVVASGPGPYDITNTGTLEFNGASLSGNVYNRGGIVGYGTLTDFLSNAGIVTLIGSLTLQTAPNNTGTILVGTHLLNVSPSWTNNGSVLLGGGELVTGGGTGLFINRGGVTPNGTISSNVENQGSLALTGISTVGGSFLNSAAGIATLTASELRVLGSQAVINSGTLAINNGSLNSTSGLQNNSNGLVTLSGGQILGTFTNNGRFSGFGSFTLDPASTGTLEANGGILIIPQMNGAIAATSSGTAQLNGLSLSGAAFIRGRLDARGTLNGLLSNTGIVALTGNFSVGTITSAAGRILVGSNRLSVNSNWTNSGSIQVSGGVLRTGNGAGLFTNSNSLSMAGTIDSGFINRNFFGLTNAVTITGAFTNSSAARTQLNGHVLTAKGNTGTSISGTVIIGQGTFVSLNGTRNFGSITLAGGAILGGSVTNQSAISGYGYVTDVLNNPGATVSASGGTLTISIAPGSSNRGNLVSQANASLVLASGVVNTYGGVILLNGGKILGATLTNLGSVQGYGVVASSAFENVASGTVRVNAGSLVISTALTPTNFGTIQVGSNKLVVTSDWTNYGFIRLQGGTIQTSGVFVNHGTIQSGSAIEGNFVNEGVIKLTDNNVFLGNFTNSGAGVLHVGTQTLQVIGDWTNQGTIDLNGGRLVGAALTNFGTVEGTGKVATNVNNGNYFVLNGPLAVGADFLNAGTLDLNGFTLTFDSGTLSNLGHLHYNGGSVRLLQTQTNTGALLFSNEATIEANFVNTGSAIVAGLATISGNFNNNGLTEVGSISLNIEGAAYGAINTGSLTLIGGTMNAESGFSNIGSMSAYGYINAPLSNAGILKVMGEGQSLTISSVAGNSGTILVGANEFFVEGNWVNNGYVSVAGGSIRTGGGFGLFTNANYISVGSSINSDFTNTGTFTLTDPVSVTGNFTNSATGWTVLNGFELQTQGASGVNNAGTILVGSGTINSINGLTNSLGALIRLTGGDISGAPVNNSGSVTGSGVVGAIFTNALSGIITATGGSLVFTSVLTNGGLMRLSGSPAELRSHFANEGDGVTSGVLRGTGTYTFAPSGEATFSNTATQATNLGGQYDTRALAFDLRNGTMNVEVTSNDIGSNTAVPSNGFSLGTLTLANTLSLLRLTDFLDNHSGGSLEAIYVKSLYLGSGLGTANFEFNGLTIYYQNIIGDGGVNFRGIGFNDPLERVTHFGNIVPLNTPIAAVPEPGTMTMILVGVPILWIAWSRKRKMTAAVSKGG